MGTVNGVPRRRELNGQHYEAIEPLLDSDGKNSLCDRSDCDSDEERLDPAAPFLAKEFSEMGKELVYYMKTEFEEEIKSNDIVRDEDFAWPLTGEMTTEDLVRAFAYMKGIIISQLCYCDKSIKLTASPASKARKSYLERRLKAFDLEKTRRLVHYTKTKPDEV